MPNNPRTTNTTRVSPTTNSAVLQSNVGIAVKVLVPVRTGYVATDDLW